MFKSIYSLDGSNIPAPHLSPSRTLFWTIKNVPWGLGNHPGGEPLLQTVHGLGSEQKKLLSGARKKATFSIVEPRHRQSQGQGAGISASATAE